MTRFRLHYIYRTILDPLHLVLLVVISLKIHLCHFVYLPFPGGVLLQ